MEFDEMLPPEELDVQKAVVEELAADKAVLDERIAKLEAENKSLKEELKNLRSLLVKNSDGPESSRIALLDRDEEIPDRFPGESRDHVLEVLKEARAKAEADGRLRLAQILEGVLVANEPNGTLAQERQSLEKLFADNGNIISGPVIDELNNRGISHKNGESYLLPQEIIKRTF